MRAKNIFKLMQYTLLLILFCASNAISAKSFLWQANSNETTVYLLGSVHMGVPSMYPMPRVIQQAYQNSDVIVVEVNENAGNPLEVQQTMQMMGMYPGSETIADHVDNTTYQALTRYLQHL